MLFCFFYYLKSQPPIYPSIHPSIHPLSIPTKPCWISAEEAGYTLDRSLILLECTIYTNPEKNKFFFDYYGIQQIESETVSK